MVTAGFDFERDQKPGFLAQDVNLADFGV